MADFVNALVHAELFLLGVASTPTTEALAAGDPAAGAAAEPATTTISFSASDYRSAAA
ncbi:hypothetical protein [Bordetella sp. BOR01]|uniref:hypothetical protein n=1 Tax=Bordetella sp. BOR01 TaxID=2854779 RepID=UPI001C4397AB|nr:hypothetical protein [Bordetella sp. BOR01]MBV7481843.1 hypothetical protein [Bordetella sp. BOR01]